MSYNLNNMLLQLIGNPYFSFCSQFSIVPPTLSTLTVYKSSTEKKKKEIIIHPTHTFRYIYTPF